MRDRLLTYALLGSIVAHVLVLGLIGRTSAAKPIDVEQLKVVRVDVVRTPEDVEVQQDSPKANEPEPPAHEAPFVPPPSKMVVDNNPPKPVPVPPNVDGQQKTGAKSNAVNTQTTATSKSVSSEPGDPGGGLSGIASPTGEDLGQVASGSTSVGWVPGKDGGKGQGSGSGAGVGFPEPSQNTKPGPGLTQGTGYMAPPVRPVEQPKPKRISVTVCAASGLIPGPNCSKKERRSFTEGFQPTTVCSQCRPPEPAQPKHTNRIADVAEPKLVKDYEPKIPDLDESGDFTIRINYTVDKDGNVKDVQVTTSSGIKAIDQAIVDAAKKMQYKPAVQNGEPRSVNIKRTYRISM